MNRLHDNRWDQLRAAEANILSAIPSDPFQLFPRGWTRAAELSENDWSRMSNREKSISPPPMEPHPDIRRAMRPRMMRNVPERRPFRQMNEHVERRQYSPPFVHRNDFEEARREAPRRPLSPTELPGVRAIPKDYNRLFRGLLVPGDFFVKSQTRYLGPFEEMPTEEMVPENDEYIILQRMGRLPDSGKSIFRQVGTLST